MCACGAVNANRTAGINALSWTKLIVVPCLRKSYQFALDALPRPSSVCVVGCVCFVLLTVRTCLCSTKSQVSQSHSHKWKMNEVLQVCNMLFEAISDPIRYCTDSGESSSRMKNDCPPPHSGHVPPFLLQSPRSFRQRCVRDPSAQPPLVPFNRARMVMIRCK